jgi:hypothetical protein
MLAGSDVKIVTGSGAVTIQIVSPLTWGSPTRLTLDANLNVSFKAPVTVTGTGAVTIVTNDGGSGGDLLFFADGSLSFSDLSSSLIINGTNYTLVKDIAGLAAAVKQKSGGSYAFAQNYDASHFDYFNAPISTSFSGTFEGLGNVIEGFGLYGGPNCSGLFKSGTASAVMRDIRFNDLKISIGERHGSGSYGSLVGCMSGSIVNVSADGTGSFYCGHGYACDVGFIAGAANSIDRSQASGTLTFGRRGGYVGGLAGVATSISSSHAAVSISGATYEVGGLVGSAGSIANSYATGSVVSRYGAGGLAGVASQVSGSFATGQVRTNGEGAAGGLVGVGTNIVNSYATGAVARTKNSYAYLGGLAGEGSSITNSYSVGELSPPSNPAGGFIALDQSSGSLANDYWDLDTSGVSDPSQGAGNIKNDTGITGLTDKQLRSGLPAGFDPAIWGRRKKINNGYPYLLANPPPD